MSRAVASIIAYGESKWSYMTHGCPNLVRGRARGHVNVPPSLPSPLCFAWSTECCGNGSQPAMLVEYNVWPATFSGVRSETTPVSPLVERKKTSAESRATPGYDAWVRYTYNAWPTM